MVSPAVAVPVVLASIAVIDGVLAGFRAAAGRNGRIRKRGYYLIAMRRGLATGAAVLGCLALVLGVVLATAPDPPTRYASLTRAGATMLWVIGPFAVVVLVSLLGYAVLPWRAATFLMLLGLGPLTLVRPWVTVTAGLAAACAAPDLLTAGCTVLAGTSVLAVEPLVHHRWYADPV